MKFEEISITAENNLKQTPVITRSHTTTNNRAPKLHSLKYQAVFSETIGSVGIDDADFSPQIRPKVNEKFKLLTKGIFIFLLWRKCTQYCTN